MEWTKSIWTMNAESAKRIGHPAPFPEELPYRLIQLYSFKNDIVLDPFMGSGTTGVAAGFVKSAVHCECSQQSIIFVLQNLLPNKKIEVETIETVLSEADKCKFRINVK